MTDETTPKTADIVPFTILTGQPVDWAQCAQLYQTGTGADLLAAKYGVGVATIWRGLRRMGVSRKVREEVKSRLEQVNYQSRMPRKGRKSGSDAEELDPEDELASAIVENEAGILAGVQLRHQRVLAKGMRAVEMMVTRLVDAECTKVVLTKTGLPVTISASEEIKHLTATLKVLVPLERQAHGLENADEEEVRRKALAAAQNAETLLTEVNESLKRAEQIATGKLNRLARG